MENKKYLKCKFYNLTNDHLFKEVFRREDNLKILLKDFFNLSCLKIIYKNGEILQKNKKNKYGTVDILIELDTSINCILEMQNNNEYNLEGRLLFYSSSITSDDGLKIKDDYSELKKVKALAIINYKEEKYCSLIEANLIDDNGLIFSDKTNYKVFNLQNCSEKYKNKPLYKMFTCKSLKEIEKYKDDPTYKQIYEMIRYYNLEEKERKEMDRVAQMLAEEKPNYNGVYKHAFIEGEMDGRKKGMKEGIKEGIKEGLKEGKKEGMKEGIKEGQQKRNVEIVKNMLAEKLDYRLISKITNMPISKVKSLHKAL